MPMMFAFSAISAFLVITFCYVGIALHVRKQSRQIAVARCQPTYVSQQQSQDCGASASVAQVSAQTIGPIRILEPQQRANPWNEREIRVTKNLAIVVCVFFVFVLPYGVCSVIPGSYIPFICFSVLLLSNSIINPVIYAFKHPVFSEVFRSIFTCRWRKVPEPSSCLRSLLRRR